jgi:hypothetical protein
MGQRRNEWRREEKDNAGEEGDTKGSSSPLLLREQVTSPSKGPQSLELVHDASRFPFRPTPILPFYLLPNPRRAINVHPLVIHQLKRVHLP